MHEAGHGVAAVLLGLSVVSVTVAGLISFGDGRTDLPGETTGLCTEIARLVPGSAKAATRSPPI